MSNEQLSGDDQAYAALEKEFGDKPEAVSQPTEAKAPETKETTETVSEQKPVEAEKQPERLPYEELDKRYKNLNGALAETRAEAKAAREREKNMQAVLARLIEDRKQQTQPQDEYVDPVEKAIRDLDGRTRQLTEAQEAFQRQQRAQFEEQSLMNVVVASEQEYAKSTPDYFEAVEHLKVARLTELESIYPDDSPNAINLARQYGMANPAQLRARILADEAKAVSKQAIENGTTPADTFYRLAKARGWTGPKPVAAPAPAPVAQPQKIDAIRKGLDAPSSLSSGTSTPSKGAEGFPSIEELADMYVSDPKAAEATFQKMRSAGLLG